MCVDAHKSEKKKCILSHGAYNAEKVGSRE